jgi:hypothetical protein
MDDGYWVLFGFITFIILVFTILHLNANGFFQKLSDKLKKLFKR